MVNLQPMMIEPASHFSFAGPVGQTARRAGPRATGDSGPPPGTAGSADASPAEDGPEQLSEADRQQVQELKQRDREVRAHEHAHQAAGAGVVQGGAQFTLQRGPDGKSYAVGGEVKIDTAAEKDPDQTIRKMQQVKRAALAPAEPSSTDRAVAAQAAQVEAQARLEKNRREQTVAESDTAAGAPGISTAGRPPYRVAGLGMQVDIVV